MFIFRLIFCHQHGQSARLLCHILPVFLTDLGPVYLMCQMCAESAGNAGFDRYALHRLYMDYMLHCEK